MLAKGSSSGTKLKKLNSFRTSLRKGIDNLRLKFNNGEFRRIKSNQNSGAHLKKGSISSDKDILQDSNNPSAKDENPSLFYKKPFKHEERPTAKAEMYSFQNYINERQDVIILEQRNEINLKKIGELQ